MDEGQSAVAVTTPATTSMHMDVLTTKPEEKQVDFASVVPEQYKEKEWVQNISRSENPNKIEELFNQFENSQKLIGSRPQGLQIPGTDANEEQVKAFHKALGVPDDIKAYELKSLELQGPEKELVDYLESQRPQAFMDEMKKAAQKHGITPKQLQGMLEAHDRTFIQMSKENLSQLAESNKQLNSDFETQAKRRFGTNWEAALERGRNILKANLNPEEVQELHKLDNASLIHLASTLDKIHSKYVKEDSLMGQGNGNGSYTLDGIRDENKRIMALPEFQDPLHSNHNKVVQQYKSNFEKMKEIMARR